MEDSRPRRALLAWQPLAVDARLMEGAWLLLERYRLSWWDALIIAAAQAAGCRYLLSEDFQEHQSLRDLSRINPFRTLPEALDLA